MSRATIILILIVLALIGGLVWLSHRSVAVAPHHVEKVVTLNGADAAHK